MHVLLTGATGFIGRHILNGLLNSGHNVIAPIRPQSIATDRQPQESDRLHYVLGSFFDPDVLNSIEDHIDTVIHVAAIRGAGQAKKQDYERVNVDGAEKLINFSIKNKIPRFLYVSTVGVLGTIPDQLPAGPDQPFAPDGEYHLSKWKAEKIVQQAESRDLHTLILRPTITYGQGDNGFIPRMIRFIQKGLLVLPNKDVLIHLLSVNCLARLINQILALNLFNGRTYHVADQYPIEIHELAVAIAQKTGGRFRNVPSFFFEAGAKFFSAIGRNDLKTSLLLLSKSWYYNIDRTVKDLLFEPCDTLAQINTLFEEEKEIG